MTAVAQLSQRHPSMAKNKVFDLLTAEPRRGDPRGVPRS
jgi:hypothetical protein